MIAVASRQGGLVPTALREWTDAARVDGRSEVPRRHRAPARVGGVSTGAGNPPDPDLMYQVDRCEGPTIDCGPGDTGRGEECGRRGKPPYDVMERRSIACYRRRRQIAEDQDDRVH